jgi:RNA polymerase sigma-70 factor (ECF subfamily)
MEKGAGQLLGEARRGREAAFLRLFDVHHLPLFRFAWRLTGSTADAEDIVQECFLALLRPECGFDPSRTSLRTYLFGTVRNQALKRLRGREQAEGAMATESPDYRTPESEALRGETAEAVADAIAALPETQREVLLLAHYEQLSLAEIAEITELEITAVKSRLQRARAALRETLATYAPGAERAI